MTSRWQAMNTTMNSRSNAQNSFSSNLYSRDSRSKPLSNTYSNSLLSQNKNNKYNHNQYSMNNNNNNNQTIRPNMNGTGFSFNRNINTKPQQQQNTNFLSQILTLLQSNAIRLFASYPIWIQGIITAIIGFIAYFFFDFADGQESIQSFLFYKLSSFIGFLVSVALLYLLWQNIVTNNNRPRLRPTLPTSLNPNNPYSSISSQPNEAMQRDQDNVDNNRDQAQFGNIGGPKRDELYFTKKAMNRVSSSTYNVDPKYDYSSSPTKIASYDPNQIVTREGLNKFLNKQSKQNQNKPLQSMTTPMASGVINSNIKTPIGKAFGSMRMTPAVKAMGSIFDTPSKAINANNGSANIYTPGSSNMDVTMLSYDNNISNDNDDPFKNLEYSAIHPTPINGNKPSQQAVAWNVSGFGGGGVATGAGLHDASTIAQPGTPSRINNFGNSRIGGGIGTGIGTGIGGGGYDYSGMYSDINLRGDNIGQVTKQTNALNANNNLLNTLSQQNQSKNVNITRAPPISPFSRKPEQEKRKKASLLSKRASHDRMNPVVFTTMGIKKSHFAAYYMEQSINLYSDLNIDTLIVNWAESMRWWLAEMVKTRCHELFTNNNNIQKIFHLLEQKYNLKQQLSQFKTASQKEQFIIQNEQQLLNVAKSENNPRIPHIIQKRKHLKEVIDFITNNYRVYNQDQKVTEYVYNRMKQLSSANNLSLFNWNRGDGKEWQPNQFPTDAHLIMSLFCRYMDDAMCPAVKFSEKHYFEISRNDIKKIHKLYKKFKDIAIICVSDINTNRLSNRNSNNRNNFVGYNANINNNKDDNDDLTAKDSLPYYFIAFNKEKFGKIIKGIKGQNAKSNIRKPQHFVKSIWNTMNDSFNNYMIGNNVNKDEIKEDLSDDDNYYHKPVRGGMRNKRNKNKLGQHADSVGTWFPQPGKNNLLHTITLFAVFLHRCCNDKLTGIALKDQGCTLLQPILR